VFAMPSRSAVKERDERATPYGPGMRSPADFSAAGYSEERCSVALAGMLYAALFLVPAVWRARERL